MESNSSRSRRVRHQETFPWALEDCLDALQAGKYWSALREESMVKNRKRNYMQMRWYPFWDTYTIAVSRPHIQQQLFSGAIRKWWSEERHEVHLWYSWEVRKWLGPPRLNGSSDLSNYNPLPSFLHTNTQLCRADDCRRWENLPETIVCLNVWISDT